MRSSLLILLISILSCSLHAQERQKVPGTNVSMVKPNNFIASNQFKGFTHTPTGTSIVLFETDKIVSSLYIKHLNDEYFQSQNLVLESEETIDLESSKAYLFKCSTETDGAPLYRVFYVTGDVNRTVVVVVHIHQDVYEELYPLVHSSLLSIRYE